MLAVSFVLSVTDVAVSAHPGKKLKEKKDQEEKEKREKKTTMKGTENATYSCPESRDDKKGL